MSKQKSTQLFAAMGEFDTPAQLYRACEKVRDAGYRAWDAYSPFPIHGLEKAMGLSSSKVPWIALVCGLLGLGGGFFMEWWTSAVDYPLIISGKPLFSWPAFVPVVFELAVLFAAFGAVIGMLIINRLPQHYHPLFQSEHFARVTDDKFFIAIESSDPKFDAQQTIQFLQSLGAVHTELIEP
jgi:hypothetical protein